MSFQVFISYSSRNLCEATEVRQALEDAGIRCWMAPWNMIPGVPYPRLILRALAVTPVVVVVLSTEANGSRHVAAEVERGFSRGKQLLVVRIEDVQPQDVLEYCLSLAHWLDAFPASLKDSLARVIAAVKFHLAEAAPCSVPEESDVPPDWEGLWNAQLRSPDLRGLVLRLADSMVRQGRPFVPLEDLTPPEQQRVAHLASLGLVQCQTQAPAGRQVMFATSDVCTQALAEWVTARVDDPEQDILACMRRLPLLADGVAQSICRDWHGAGQALLLRLVSTEEPIIERTLSGIASTLCLTPTAADELFQTLPRGTSLAALRGVARAGQRLMESRSWEAAGEVFRRLAAWLYQAPAGGDTQRDRLLAEISNEQGRLWRRQGKLDDAVGQFRRTIDLAESLGDELLTGIATNNLAGALLEQDAGPGDLRREALQRLEQNIERLRGCDATRHLAVTYHQLGKAHRELNPRAAEEYYRQDVFLCRSLKDDLALADALDTLASFLTDQQRYQEAEQTHQEELALFQRVFDLQRHARALANQGRVCLRQGLLGDRAALDRGCRHLEQSCQWYSSLDVPEEYAPALENLGRGHFLEGDEGGCRQRLEQAIAQYRRIRGGEEIARQIQAELEQLRNR